MSINTSQANQKLGKVKNKTMRKTRFSVNGYAKPTPAKFRKIGDALLVSSTIVSSQFPDNPKIMLASQLVGIVGKFLTNFFH